MVSFFRRKKPEDASSSQDGSTRRYSVEELAAAFPDARPATPPAADPAAAIEQARQTAPVEATPAPQTPDTQTFAPADDGQPDFVVPAPSPQRAEPAPVPATPVAAEPTPVAKAPKPVAPEPITTPPPTVVTAPAVVPAPQATAPASVPPPSFATTEKPAAPAGKTGWRERLRGSVFARSFGGLFSRNPKLDDDLLDEIETALITADVGVGATTALVEGLRKRMKAREFADAQALLQALRAELVAILQPVALPLVIDAQARPFVVLTVGVNGVGKTTTIGKLAKRFKDDGHSLMLAAGDTFRAAAVAQLQAWGDRNGVTVIAQGQNADAASVAFDALQAGKARGTEVLIADTAGRLHTQTGLMNELGKIRRVLGKIDPSAPHEVLMVIDGTTGQNALSQLRQFHAAVGVTGLVVTKLDGTAKGGVVFALAREFGIPIRYAGIGERPEDLRVFDAEAFVDALLPEALGTAA